MSRDEAELLRQACINRSLSFNFSSTDGSLTIGGEATFYHQGEADRYLMGIPRTDWK